MFITECMYHMCTKYIAAILTDSLLILFIYELYTEQFDKLIIIYYTSCFYRLIKVGLCVYKYFIMIIILFLPNIHALNSKFVFGSFYMKLINFNVNKI